MATVIIRGPVLLTTVMLLVSTPRAGWGIAFLGNLQIQGACQIWDGLLVSWLAMQFPTLIQYESREYKRDSRHTPISPLKRPLPLSLQPRALASRFPSISSQRLIGK